MSEQHVSASRIIHATPEAIFTVLTDPSLHSVIDGSNTVQSARGAATRLELGSKFGMNMRLGVPYIIGNTVTEYEENRLIGWRHLGQWVWRWELEPVESGDTPATRVTETFDWGVAPTPNRIYVERLGWPRKNLTNIERSLDRLDAYFSHRARAL